MASKVGCTVALLLLGIVGVRSAEETCRDAATCEDFMVNEASKASAMMQVKSKVATSFTSVAAVAASVKQSFTSAASAAASVIQQLSVLELQAARLEESRSCMPLFLQEFHRKAIRQHAAADDAGRKGILASLLALQELGDKEQRSLQDHASLGHKARQSTLEDLTQDPVATVAPIETTIALDAEGFKTITSLCCPEKMETFFNRLLDKFGYDVCSKPHVQGLMHWFQCVPSMDFQYLLDVIQNGNPCKYWSPKGQTCPTLSEQCAGQWCR